MPAPRRFRDVLAAAVEDLTRSGFDSNERVERWMRQLGEAARASLISVASLEQTLRDALAAKYRSMVDQAGVLQFNPGVDRFTLERIKPSLRGELDRRISASANLIRLDRDRAIARTLGRFQGWATSIPAGGGVSAESSKEVKKDISKGLASLPFVERRVLIDQGHKLVAAISDVVARDGGAIAARWRSHWRQAGYDYREDHKDRDEGVFLVRDSWAQRAGLVRKGAPGYADEVTQPAQEPFCRCYWIWLYSLRELPADMLTAKGRQSLLAVEGREEVRAARLGRADDASEGASGHQLQEVTFRNRGKLHYGLLDKQGERQWLRAACSCPGSQRGTLTRGAAIVCEGWEKANCGGRKGRDDDTADPKMTQREAVYGPVWSNRQTRCVRCSMFVLGPRLYDDNACTAVAGRIAAHGHCRLFEPTAEPRSYAAPPHAGGLGENAGALAQAVELDQLGYLDGLSGGVREIADVDNWNSTYDADRDDITLQAKFSGKAFADKVQTFLHEAGHRGQEVDAGTYQAFVRLGMDKLSSFVAIANPTHLKDFARHGIDNVAEEVFAESYSRSMLGLELPAELAEFWQTRLAE
jgi:hypothetical protein